MWNSVNKLKHAVNSVKYPTFSECEFSNLGYLSGVHDRTCCKFINWFNRYVWQKKHERLPLKPQNICWAPHPGGILNSVHILLFFQLSTLGGHVFETCRYGVGASSCVSSLHTAFWTVISRHNRSYIFGIRSNMAVWIHTSNVVVMVVVAMVVICNSICTI